MSATTEMYILCAILCLIGFFFMGLCYYTIFFTTSSGAPFIGGIFVAIGFLLSPFKWLALLGLLDYGVWGLPYAIIEEWIEGKRRRKFFDPFYEEKAYLEKTHDETKSLFVRIRERDEELEWSYVTRAEYTLNIPSLVFSICLDKDSNRFLLTEEPYKSKQIKVYPFNEDMITLTELPTKKGTMTVEIEVRERDNKESDAADSSTEK